MSRLIIPCAGIHSIATLNHPVTIFQGCTQGIRQEKSSGEMCCQLSMTLSLTTELRMIKYCNALRDLQEQFRRITTWINCLKSDGISRQQRCTMIAKSVACHRFPGHLQSGSLLRIRLFRVVKLLHCWHRFLDTGWVSYG
jgi:hypothetical protein